MEETPAGLVTASLQRVFAERDSAARQAAAARIFASDVEFRDGEGEARGHAELEAKVAGLLETAPADWVFEARGAAQELTDLARVSWTFGPPAGPAAVSGTDIAFVVDGRIQRMYTFLDEATTD